MIAFILIVLKIKEEFQSLKITKKHIFLPCAITIIEKMDIVNMERNVNIVIRIFKYLIL